MNLAKKVNSNAQYIYACCSKLAELQPCHQSCILIDHAIGGINVNNISFADIAVLSCGTLSLALNYLKKEGFLDTPIYIYTTPGLHGDIHELEAQLTQRINKAKEKAAKVHVVRATASITLSEFVFFAVDGSFAAAKEYERLKRIVIMRKINGQNFKESTACHCQFFFSTPQGLLLGLGDYLWIRVPFFLPLSTISLKYFKCCPVSISSKKTTHRKRGLATMVEVIFL